MPNLPISKKKLDKLGDRLRDAPVPDPRDLDLLEAVLGAYNEALQYAAERLRDLGFWPTTRLKTTGTIVEKLRRERSCSLKTIQDLAGARVVIGGTTRAQDTAVAAISGFFADAANSPAVIDRRADPSSGYRAVHVVLKVEGIPVEIQIRTEIQDLWAQIFERLADVWGRQIRYGGAPDPNGSDRHVQARRVAIVNEVLKISEAMAQHEKLKAAVEGIDIYVSSQPAGVDPSGPNSEAPRVYGEVRSQHLDIKAKVAEIEETLQGMLGHVSAQAEREAGSR